MKTQSLFLLAPLSLALCSCATMEPKPQLDAKSAEIIHAMSGKLAAAKTVRISATRTASPGFFVGETVAMEAHINGVLQRPDKLASTARTNLGTREIRYDGKQLLLVDRAAKTHALVPAPATIDEAVTSIEQHYGFMPPLAELVVNNPEAVLLDGVKSGHWVSTEAIGKEPCEHLAFQQDNLAWEIWVSAQDQLPRQLRVTYPNGEGGQPMVMTVTIQNVVLDGPVNAAEFKLTIPAGSRELQMIPLND